MRRIGGDMALYKFKLFAGPVDVVRPLPVAEALLLQFSGLSNDDIGMVAFIGPTFCMIPPSDGLPRTLHVVVDISIMVLLPVCYVKIVLEGLPMWPRNRLNKSQAKPVGRENVLKL